MRALLLLILPFVAGGFAEGQEIVRVGILCKSPPKEIRVNGPCVAQWNGGRMTVRRGKSASLKVSGGGVLVAGKSVTSVDLRAQDLIRLVVDGAERAYRGRITARASHGRLLLVNHVSIEDYLRGVLPGEMPHDWPIEALAAQAVVARSFAVAEMGRHSRDGYDFCELTHCQAYRGASWERQSTDRAVRMTAGQVLTYSGKVIPAPYHSTCGGKTCASVEYLSSVDDSKGGEAYCAESDHSRWSSTIAADDLRRALKTGGRITDIRVLGRDSTGRAAKIEVKADRSVVITASEFHSAIGRELGWTRIKSTWFDVRKSGDFFIFTGKGLGHGMGLCQWGARGMAKQGRSCEEILRHYYPKCLVERR